MASLTADVPVDSILATIPIPKGVDATDFIFAISNANEGIRIEQSKRGFLTLMTPPGFDTSDRNGEILFQIRAWNKKKKRGRCTDSDTLFVFPDGKMLGPDAAWISHERLAGLSKKETSRFIARMPEFVVELLSPSDSKSEARRKMAAWMEAGVQLAWLIDPKDRSVEIYKADQPVSRVKSATQVMGNGPMDGFTLNLSEIWAI